MRRNEVPEGIETLGYMFAGLLACGFLATVIAVWIMVVNWPNYSGKFWDMQSSIQGVQINNQGLEQRVDALTNAWNAKFPDHKVNEPERTICIGTGCQ